MMTMITRFSGEHEFLSNFYLHPFKVPGVNDWWNTAEHAFQAAKATRAGDYTNIRDARSAAEAKRLGRGIPCRPDWDKIRRKVMLTILLAKFDEPDLAAQLAATAPATLIEGNTWGDTFWGATSGRIGAGKDLPCWAASRDDLSYVLYGQNWLGRQLMMVREVII